MPPTAAPASSVMALLNHSEAFSTSCQSEHSPPSLKTWVGHAPGTQRPRESCSDDRPPGEPWSYSPQRTEDLTGKSRQVRDVMISPHSHAHMAGQRGCLGCSAPPNACRFCAQSNPKN